MSASFFHVLPLLELKEVTDMLPQAGCGSILTHIETMGRPGSEFQRALRLRILLNHCKQGTYALRVPDTSLLSMQTTGLGICQHIEASTALNKSLQSVPEMVPLVESQTSLPAKGKMCKDCIRSKFLRKKIA